MPLLADPLPTAPTRWWRVLLICALLVAVAHAGDPWAWADVRVARVNDKEWGRLLRSLGYVPTWIAMALALWLEGRERPASAQPVSVGAGRVGAGWRAIALFMAPTFGGALAEGVKLVVRRLRPADDAFGYAFRAFSERPWSTGGLGMASSHAAVAFGGAALLARLFPRARVVWYSLAAGCGLVRVMSGNHFLSDVVAGAAIGWIAAALVWRWAAARAQRLVLPLTP